MTTGLTCTWTTPEEGTARVTIAGDLEFATTGTLLRLVTDRLAACPGVREVRLDCGELGFCDSSELLKVLRVVADAGARLRLDHRRAAPERLLTRTGTAAYLTGEGVDSRARRDS
ncbi:anti-anti-sigma factor [Amycolatopsis mediterranei S699]|uniref:Anti-anti-sigma factor n=2 Tax=Amycolatopsis mediterranei TaxID=33910 RepID=A0A0H3DBF9_AMYMU|nr:anti-anti-sigma factor [Amycolatopsis mediterranei U32]AEK43719.1 anti-anti-sigma factor [Amycolatopsis mediterranei S699]AGT85748.1 anti-anti-sigma factor [Amycolatopsis mediterranei RB]KDO04656.1 anti-anti-sigma factor [Amycolatopsis mediterranei]AFO78620.1 anti-anti-sigma factor [Amycolatopsis mediterranei S699]